MADINLTGMTQEDLVKFISKKTGRVFINYNQFNIIAGSVAIAAVGGTLAGAYAFDASSVESVTTLWECPKDADVTKPMKMYVVWSSPGVTAVDAVWDIDYAAVAAGEDMGVALTAGTVTDTDSTTADAQMISDAVTVAANTFAAVGEKMIIAVSRDADATGDTVAGDASFYGLLITYESTPSISAS